MKSPDIKGVEPGHKGSAWSHPYMIFVVLTAGLFMVLLVMGYLAKENGWIPSRGNQVGSPSSSGTSSPQ